MPDSVASGSISSKISTAKDLFALLRDVALGALVVLLLLFPATFNDRLTRAGFEEGSFAGLKWKAKLEQSDVGLKEARAQINDLTEQLGLATQKLREAEERLSDPKFKAEVEKFDVRAASVKSAAEKVAANVTGLISSNAPLVERGTTTTGEKWGVVFGGDTKLEKARYEVETVARKYGVANASIFLDKNGSYRSVSVVETPAEAREVLAKARQKRPDAYIVRMGSWCPNSVAKDGYSECAPVSQ